MKYFLLFAITAAACGLTSCKRTYNQEVVKETFIHKYGVQVPKEDWSRNGKDGQVAQLMSDGVTITKSYEKGILEGVTTHTFPNSSTIQYAETYRSGELASKVINYLSGVPHEEIVYDGSQISQITRWYEDGTPAALETFQNGLMVSGEFRNPQNIVESTVEEGFGLRIVRGNDGELIAKDSFHQGQLLERVAYFANGEPSAVIPYERGQVHGMRLTFLPGGIPSTVEQWVHGQQEGTTIVYLNGEKISEVPFVKGQKNGVELRFRDGSTIVEEVTWKNDIQHGPRRILLDDTAKTEWYHEGELVTRTTFERLNTPR